MAVAALVGSAALASPVAAFVAAVGLAVLAARAGVGIRILGLAALAGLVTAGRARHVVDRFENDRITVRDALGAPARCGAEAQVRTSPVWRDGTAVFTADLSAIDCEGRHLPEARARLFGGPADLVRGDRLVVVAQLGAVRLFRNAELPDPTLGAARRGVVLSGSTIAVERAAPGIGITAVIDRARAHARRRIVASFAPAAAPMARALVLGEEDLEDLEADAFRASGLAHMLAVSGTHLVFAVLGIVAALRYCLVRVEILAARFDVERASAVAGVVLAIAYADFAGGSGSAWRAAWMLAGGLGARALGRRPSGARALALSVLVAAVFDPLLAFDLSLLLSGAATAGLLTLGRTWAAWVDAKVSGPLRYLSISFVATVTSMLPCTPLLAVFVPRVTMIGLLANLVAAPLGEAIALPLCLVHVLLAPFPWLERGVALVASGALLAVRAIAYASAAARVLAIPVLAPQAWHWVVMALTLARCGLSRSRWPALLLGGLAFGIVELGAWRAGHPRGLLRVTAVDVGQGDAELVDLPDGSLMLVDGGGFVGSPVDPGARVLLPLLRARRRRRIDVAVLTHPHPDHLLGLATVLGEVEVGELWDSGFVGPDGAGAAHQALLAALAARRVPVKRPAELCSVPHAFADASIEVLGPCPGPAPESSANDASIVLRIRLGGRAAVLPGDAERGAEAILVRRYGIRLRADYLKVGHHGSRSSTSPDFLAMVAPDIATVSTDVRNRHGHPHQVTMERLSGFGVTTFRLDRCGSLMWTTDGIGTKSSVFGCERGAEPWPAR
ncbi:MAG: DNA internalization-related competence protein ComEC/Rec2 [Polyangiaceae bacterium]|nr:DNA internalization-related competence protein ComEC/Rec2 [Polyangiaceae bacterium]